MAGDVVTAGSAGSEVTQAAGEQEQQPAAAQTAAPAAPAGAAGAVVRRRLARLGASRVAAVNPVLEPLIKIVRATHPKADVRLLEHAYDIAARQHAGQLRKSGDPYITHPLAVATILAELGMNTTALAAALLHDTIENSEYPLDQLQA